MALLRNMQTFVIVFITLTAIPTSLCQLDIDDNLRRFLGTLEPYEQTENDIIFVLDESGSIGADNFPQVILFMELIARQLSISEGASRVAVMTFATDPRTHIDYIKESHGNNMCTLLKDIAKIDYLGEWTHTSTALTAAKDLMSKARKDANRILILVTDGRSNDGYDPTEVARTLKNEGVIIFAVGVADVNEAELEAVATSKAHIYILKDFQYIYKVNEFLKQDIKEVGWDNVNDNSLCNSFCSQGTDCCDAHADCYCGTKGGSYECGCRAGYYGTGHRSDCRQCPKGTYKKKEGNNACDQCPENSTTLVEGSTSVSDCVCIAGHEGNPHIGEPCKSMECVKLGAPEGGILIPSSCGHSYGSECSFKCKEGYCPYFCNETVFVADEFSIPWNQQSLETRKCLDTKLWSGADFHCEKMRCPALNYPNNGNHNCSGTELTYGTVCELSCDNGYTLKGSSLRTCLISGKWDGTETQCKAVTCTPLKTNQYLILKPKKCGTEPMPYSSSCQYYCKKGYLLVSSVNSTNASLGVRECLENQKWSHSNERFTCKDNTHPTIKCPDSDIRLQTDKHKPTALVYWDLPQASDNIFVKRVEIIEPKNIRKPPHNFPIGESKIVYQATDSSGLTDTCSFMVHVIDKESPRVKSCPEDIEKYHDKKTGLRITWNEPEFLDNSGKTSISAAARKSGDSFSWGPSNIVNYTASDPSGNMASCSFTVKVKPYPCPYAEPPTHGSVACDNWLDGRVCSVYCNEGYEFVGKPEPIYFCWQNTLKWGRPPGKGQSRLPVKFPWPDCAKIQSATGANVTLETKFTVSGCSQSKEEKERIEAEFIKLLKIKFPHICNEKIGCKPGNIKITCKKLSDANLRRKRQINDETDFINKMDDVLFEIINPLTGHHLRHKHTRRSTEDSVLEISFNFEVPVEDTLTPLDDCENCDYSTSNITSEEFLTIVSSITDELKDNISSVIQEVYPDSTPLDEHTTYKIVPTCDVGQILINNSCVNCPAGTYFDGGRKSCEECGVGSYQDVEASLFCLKCPEGTTNFHSRSKSVYSCKAPCQPGSYSSNGFEPCIACRNNTYQDQLEAKSCNSCPTGSFTWTVGASLLKDCVSYCSPGSYSDTGYEPCMMCPLATYQPSSRQTSCISCPQNQSTAVEGARALQYCHGIHPCNELQPCSSGATCIDTDENQYECLCPEGMTGRECEINVDDCSSDLCDNDGSCIDGLNNYTCLCRPGFGGQNCEININDCESDSCQNDGICIDEINSYTCKCQDGFTGQNCEININDCASNPCENGGTCFDMQNSFRCCCPIGFTGDLCEMRENKCGEQPCQNGATCISKLGGFDCLCPLGFEGRLCETNVDDCKPDVCQNGGICIDGVANATCECPKLYGGHHCEEALSSEYEISFSSPMTSNYAKLENSRPLFAITVSFFMRTYYEDSNNRGTPFSYSYHNPTSGLDTDNAFTLLDVNKLVLYIHGQSFHTGYIANSNINWHHYGITWESLTGDWMLLVDGENVASGSSPRGGYMWPGIFVLGQEQDSLGGSFSITESFVGDITQFNVWDYAMTRDEIRQISSACGFVGNVIAWPEVQRSIHGEVAVRYNVDLCKANGICSVENCNCINSHQPAEMCKGQIDNCADTCTNGECLEANGTFCICEPGYDGRLCQYDINECLLNNGNCSHSCINTFGSYYCACPQTMSLTSDGHNCAVTSYCKVEKNIFVNGEVWESNCQKCECQDGYIFCSNKDCPNITCAMDEIITLLPGNCCGKCMKQPSQCNIYSNNTFVTFDDFNYQFTGSCRYTVAEDCISGEFSIHMEPVEYDSSKKDVIFYIHCTKVKIDPIGNVEVNDHRISFPFQANKNVHIESIGTKIKVTSHQGFSLEYDQSGLITVNMPQSFRKKICGLCGNFNYNSRDDMATKHYLPARTASEFINSWKVDEYRHCKQPPRSTIPAKTKLLMLGACDIVPLNVQRRAQKLCNILKNPVFKPCYKKVKPHFYYELCLQDSCSCKANEPCHCDSITAYVMECRRNNVNIKKWTSQNICELQCSGGMVYDDCGPPYRATCFTSSKGQIQSSSMCLPGCHCPAHMVLHNGVCIERNGCPSAIKILN